MTTYSSKEVKLEASPETVFRKLSNLENLKGILEKIPSDRIPDDKREMFEKIVITSETIEVPGAPVGNIVFRLVDKQEPSFIKLAGEGLPIAMALSMHIEPEGETDSKARVDIEVDLPLMLKPLVGGQIQKMADQFAQVLTAIPF